MWPSLRLSPGLFWAGPEGGRWGLSVSPFSLSVSLTSLYSTAFQKLSLLNPVSWLERHGWVSPQACVPHCPLASPSSTHFCSPAGSPSKEAVAEANPDPLPRAQRLPEEALYLGYERPAENRKHIEPWGKLQPGLRSSRTHLLEGVRGMTLLNFPYLLFYRGSHFFAVCSQREVGTWAGPGKKGFSVLWAVGPWGRVL